MGQRRQALAGQGRLVVLVALASLGACRANAVDTAAAPRAVVTDYDTTWLHVTAAHLAGRLFPGTASPSGNSSVKQASLGAAGAQSRAERPSVTELGLWEKGNASAEADSLNLEQAVDIADTASDKFLVGGKWRALEAITTSATSATESSTATSETETLTSTTATSSGIPQTGTDTSTLTSMTESSTSETSMSETSMTVTTTTTSTPSLVKPAVPGTTDDYTTSFQLVASLNSTETAAVCERLPEVSAPILGIPGGQISCLGFVVEGGRRLRGSAEQSRWLSEDLVVVGYFNMEAAARSEEEAAIFGFNAASLDVSALEAALQSEGLDADVINVQNVLTFRDSQPWVTYGSMQITIGSQAYTDEQAGALLKEMFVAAISDVATEDGGSFSLDAANVVVEVSDGTNVQYFINSFSAADDLLVLGQLAQSGYRVSLQGVLDGRSTDITIDVFEVVFDVSGRFTVGSDASALTDPDSYSIDAMKESIRKVATAQYNLQDEDVGVSVANIVPYVADEASSNQFTVIYSLAPALFEAYCAAGADLETAVGQERLEAALSYDGVDGSIMPRILNFSADATLGTCTAAPEDSDDDGLFATGLIIALIAGGAVVIIVLLVLLGCCFCRCRQRRSRGGGGAAAAAGPQAGGAATEESHYAERPPSPYAEGGSTEIVVEGRGPEEQDDEAETAVQRGAAEAGAYMRSDIVDQEDDAVSI